MSKKETCTISICENWTVSNNCKRCEHDCKHFDGFCRLLENLKPCYLVNNCYYKQLKEAKIKITDLENCNFSLLQEGRSFLTTMQELEELSIVQEEIIKIQTKDKIYLRAKIAEWKNRANELDDACCKITAKNIMLTSYYKQLKDALNIIQYCRMTKKNITEKELDNNLFEIEKILYEYLKINK